MPPDLIIAASLYVLIKLFTETLTATLPTCHFYGPMIAFHEVKYYIM